MALGSTAEFPHLTPQQRNEVLLRIARSALPVIANVSDVSHRVAIELALQAKDAGAVAIATLPPWFFPISQADLAEFFITIGKHSGLPLVLYNFPEVTGKKIEVETIRRVVDEVRVLAVKQSGGDFGYHHELLRLAQRHSFSVLSGADNRLGECLAMGCSGTVSGLANAVPEVLVKIYQRAQKGEKSERESELMTQLGEKMISIEFPHNVRAAIAARGFETGEPKNPVSQETGRKYQHLLGGLKVLYEKYGDCLRRDKA